MTLLQKVARDYSISVIGLSRYIRAAPYKYKVFSIPKRNETGIRTIAQPAKRLKMLQRHVLSNYLQPKMPVHESAMAYVEGRSIRDNAAKHINTPYLLKMDFQNFFPSITSDDLIQHCQQCFSDYNSEDDFLLKNLFCRKTAENNESVLSIGAPSSPFLSNSILYNFDIAVASACESKGVIYTRYADDLAFSTHTKGLLYEFPSYVQTLIDELAYPTLTINRDKTVFTSKKHNRHITGITISNDGVLSLGRQRKRMIKSFLFRFKNGECSAGDIATLKGLIGYAKHVEPSFVSTLELKYGLDLLADLNRIPFSSRE